MMQTFEKMQTKPIWATKRTMTQTFFRHGNQKQNTLFRTTGPGLKLRKKSFYAKYSWETLENLYN